MQAYHAWPHPASSNRPALVIYSRAAGLPLLPRQDRPSARYRPHRLPLSNRSPVARAPSRISATLTNVLLRPDPFVAALESLPPGCELLAARPTRGPATTPPVSFLFHPEESLSSSRPAAVENLQLIALES